VYVIGGTVVVVLPPGTVSGALEDGMVLNDTAVCSEELPPSVHAASATRNSSAPLIRCNTV
jgi:hypothetical protein